MIGVANVNGVITDMDKAVIPVLDRGFLYGDSLYEVAITQNHVPIFMDDHMDRMRSSASKMQMPLTISDAKIKVLVGFQPETNRTKCNNRLKSIEQ